MFLSIVVLILTVFAHDEAGWSKAAGRFHAGAASVDITPPVGTPMAGYAARKDVSQGIHDPLHASVLIIENGMRQAVLVTMDNVSVNEELTAAIRSAVKETAGLEPDNLMISVTHTHAGPSGDDVYRAVLAKKVAGAALMAKNRMGPVSIGFGKGHVTGIAQNRRSVDGEPTDPEVSVMRVDGENGRPIAIWVNYTAHATAMSWDNLMLSADYPGFMYEVVKAVYGRDVVVLFANGAEGDINPGLKDPAVALGMGRTKDTFGPLLDGIGELQPHRTFEQCGRIGRILGGEVIKVAERIDTKESGVIDIVYGSAELNLKEFEPVAVTQLIYDEAEKKVQALKEDGADKDVILKARVNAFLAMMRNWSARRGERLTGVSHIPARIQVMRIGDAVLAAWPGEIFSGIGMEVKRRSCLENVAIVGLANGSIGYLPTDDAYVEGGYEISNTIFARGAAEALIRETLSLIRKVQ